MYIYIYIYIHLYMWYIINNIYIYNVCNIYAVCDHEITQAMQFFWDNFLAFLHQQKPSTLDYFLRNFIKLLTAISGL